MMNRLMVVVRVKIDCVAGRGVVCCTLFAVERFQPSVITKILDPKNLARLVPFSPIAQFDV